jgi:hypothetical protein
LDAQLSYKVAVALAVVEEAFTHVIELCPEYATGTPGQNQAPDEVIAERCSDGGIVLVTADSDFRGLNSTRFVGQRSCLFHAATSV